MLLPANIDICMAFRTHDRSTHFLGIGINMPHPGNTWRGCTASPFTYLPLLLLPNMSAKLHKPCPPITRATTTHHQPQSSPHTVDCAPPATPQAAVQQAYTWHRTHQCAARRAATEPPPHMPHMPTGTTKL
eukprot:jgi/Ulvmu1/957/UM102_0040.1